MTVVRAEGDAERCRLAEALAGRARDGVVWAFDDEDRLRSRCRSGTSPSSVPPDVASTMLVRTLTSRPPPPKPFQPESVQPDPAEVEAAAEAEAENQRTLSSRLAGRSWQPDRRRLRRPPLRRRSRGRSRSCGRPRNTPKQRRTMPGGSGPSGTTWPPRWPHRVPATRPLPPWKPPVRHWPKRSEELATARLAVGHGPVSPENAAVIGHLHSEVTNAQARVDRPFPGSAARRRLAETEAAEAKFLEELGFSSYSAYLLDTIDNPADPEPLRRLSGAERAVAEAEVAWQNVAPVADELYVHQSLQRQATQLQERAAASSASTPGTLSPNTWQIGRSPAPGSPRPGPNCNVFCVPPASRRTWIRRPPPKPGSPPDGRRKPSTPLSRPSWRTSRPSWPLCSGRPPTGAHRPRPGGPRPPKRLTTQRRVARRLSPRPAGCAPPRRPDRLAAPHPRGRVRRSRPGGPHGRPRQAGEMSATVQVIYLTTDPEVLAWTATMRSDQVDVQRPQPIVPSVIPPPAAPAPAPPVAASAPAPEPFVAPAPVPRRRPGPGSRTVRAPAPTPAAARRAPAPLRPRAVRASGPDARTAPAAPAARTGCPRLRLLCRPKSPRRRRPPPNRRARSRAPVHGMPARPGGRGLPPVPRLLLR